MAPSSTALDAWSTAATLSVGADTQLAVFLSRPRCASCSSGDSSRWHPNAAIGHNRCCEPSGCSWLWERQESTEAGWEVCGTEAEYQPVAADEGALLRVRAEPPAPSTAATDEAREAALSLLGRVTEAVSAVELPPTRTQHQQRIASMASSSSSSSSFRLLSYNLLADSYSRNWDGPHSIHSYCSPTLTKASRRMPKLLHEVLSFRPDVICLQEVDKTWYQQLWLPMLSARGYTGRLTLKRGQGSSEGVATFVRDGAFEVVDVREIDSTRPLPLLCHCSLCKRARVTASIPANRRAAPAARSTSLRRRRCCSPTRISTLRIPLCTSDYCRQARSSLRRVNGSRRFAAMVVLLQRW